VVDCDLDRFAGCKPLTNKANRYMVHIRQHQESCKSTTVYGRQAKQSVHGGVGKLEVRLVNGHPKGGLSEKASEKYALKLT
jgi:hypothetical protein